MKSNLGLINSKGIRKRSCLNAEQQTFQSLFCSCLYLPFPPHLILARIFVQTSPHHILVQYYVTCYVIRSWRNTTYFQCTEPMFNCQENNKARTNPRLDGRKSVWTGCYWLFNKHLGLIYTPMPKADVPLPFKDSTHSSTHGFIAACIVCHSSLCL